MARASLSPRKGNIKGAVLREFVLWHEERFGSMLGAIRELERVNPGTFDETREAYGLLSSSWYDASLVHSMLNMHTSGLSEADVVARAEDAARVIMGRTLRGVYKTLFRMVATPDRFQKHAHSLWGQHYDTGRNEIVKLDEHSHRVRYVGWTSHHPFICRMNMAASVPIYEAMGCRAVTYERQSCTSSGAPFCENLIRWKQ